jgi:hypothetical protein
VDINDIHCVLSPSRLRFCTLAANYFGGMMAKAKAKAPVSEKREYKNPESAAKQKTQWEARGYKVTRKGNTLYLKKGK